MSSPDPRLPELPLAVWQDSKTTLHLWSQIVGKIRLKLMPRKNHWWYVTLYLTSTGLSTHAMPYNNGYDSLEINLNFLKHQLEVISSQGGYETIALVDGLSVAEFYQRLFAILQSFGVAVEIVDRPYDMPLTNRFAEITTYARYQAEYVQRFWQILRWVDGVFKEFSGLFYGKTCPVHLYWHSFDLAVTRFSGRRGAPLRPEMRLSDKDAYSHEVISFGFWPGDANVPAPAFYCYTAPSPPGLGEEPLQPAVANWIDANGSPMAVLMYDDLRQAADPRQTLLDFLESGYQAGAKRANWDIDAWTVPPLSAL